MRALACASELAVVVVCDGVKADSDVSEAGWDSSPPFEARVPSRAKLDLGLSGYRR